MYGTSFSLKSMSISLTLLFGDCKGRLQADQTCVLPLKTLVLLLKHHASLIDRRLSIKYDGARRNV